MDPKKDAEKHRKKEASEATRPSLGLRKPSKFIAKRSIWGKYGFYEKYQNMDPKVTQRLQKWSQNGARIDEKSGRKNIEQSMRKKVVQKIPKGPTRVDDDPRPEKLRSMGRFYPNRGANPNLPFPCHPWIRRRRLF